MGMDIHQLNISRETVRHHIGKLRDDYKDYLKNLIIETWDYWNLL